MSTTIQDLVLYANGVPPLPPAKQQVWNLMGQGKMAMDNALQSMALTIPMRLKDWQNMDQPALEKNMKLWKEDWAAMVEARKKFTTFLDMAKDMCMSVEKQFDPKTHPDFIGASARELSLREQAQKQQLAAQAKINEENGFKAFVTNEYFDIVAGYRNSLITIVQQAYNACLEQRTPVDNIHTAITACVATMRECRPRVMNKFDRKIITDQEAMAIFENVKKPDYQAVFNEVIAAAQQKFSLYPNDLANAEQALANQQQQFQQQQAEQAQQLEAEKAATTLMAQAQNLTVGVAGMKGVTETTEIEIKDYDDNWVAIIIAAFLANFQKCMPKVKVKKKSKLDIGQMAAALDAAGVKVEGVNYVTLKK